MQYHRCDITMILGTHAVHSVCVCVWGGGWVGGHTIFYMFSRDKISGGGGHTIYFPPLVVRNESCILLPSC